MQVVAVDFMALSKFVAQLKASDAGAGVGAAVDDGAPALPPAEVLRFLSSDMVSEELILELQAYGVVFYHGTVPEK
eukprot:7438936-Alexandrium_andersonii.AAC.1